MLAFWERLRTSPRLKGAFLYAVVLAVVAAGSFLPHRENARFASADRYAFDAQMDFLRDRFPLPVENDVVLIGTDGETEKAFPEPIALWHRHLAKTYRALALAKPRVVGVDFGLPERTFDKLVPGIDRAMMIGLVALKHEAPLVIVQHIDDREELVPVQENYRNIIGIDNLGVDRQPKEPDGVSRRFFEDLRSATTGETIPTLSGQMLRRLGRSVHEGYIDYSVGIAPMRYIPMHDVTAWFDAGDVGKIKAAFAGRIVLIGSMTGDRDRWILPVRLLERPEDMLVEESKRRAAPGPAVALSQPGVMIHVQVLRSHLANGMLTPMPEWLRALLCAIVALATLVRARPLTVIGVAILFPLGLAVVSLVSIRQAQVLIPLGSVVLAFWIALAVRAAYDTLEAILERIRMQRTFSGQVSPAVMKEMLRGGLSAGVSGQLADICVLFSDVRDFTTLSEHMSPGIVINVLQRYFDRMVKVVHKFDGTVDKFIGDGLMVLFGAPGKSADPCGDAVQCALEMMAELDALNREFESEGLPTLTIGIGVNYGTVTVGNIGSSERHNYSAIGDAVNVAARIEGLTKELGRKILITEAVVSRIGERFHFDPLGEHKLKGHSPVNVWGIRTARATPAAA
ncbi:hypothetical protein DSM104443_00439 [Usitatibacter rugosus]|uniref:Guanylate cyclase domain-containing protein n=1 Tax=Usitatibacter rugosus TaxID=2732067 RepID=A0A6M4GQR5_9PROT|nr:adenylate/guanylate cyclase domain-containing protein [Usitatibacter rugosus]QJR09395.1 hypothetical protein DSM104443_00439 [Usitatibacter rugosus]